MNSLLRAILICLLLVLPGIAQDKDYTTADQARLPGTVMAQLARLKEAGISEVLVPTWLPDDLEQARGEVHTADAQQGPQVELVWHSTKNEQRSLVFRGAAKSPEGSGPDSVVWVENPVLGDLEMMVYSNNTRAANRYSTDYSLRVSRGQDSEYYLDLRTIGNSPIGLSSPEMQKILSSVRKLKL